VVTRIEQICVAAAKATKDALRILRLPLQPRGMPFLANTLEHF
jgi:hypothetical protein